MVEHGVTKIPLPPVSMGLFFIAQEKVKKEVYQELLTSERMKKEGRTY